MGTADDAGSGAGGEMGEAAAYRFLSGAEMEPIALLAAEPAARFVARARLGGEGEAGAALGEAVWGILIRVPTGDGSSAVAMERSVTTDDGRTFRAVVDGDGRPRGDAADVLAAARYWELPPAYVRRLPGAESGDVDG